MYRLQSPGYKVEVGQFTNQPMIKTAINNLRYLDPKKKHFDIQQLRFS